MGRFGAALGSLSPTEHPLERIRRPQGRATYQPTKQKPVRGQGDSKMDREAMSSKMKDYKSFRAEFYSLMDRLTSTTQYRCAGGHELPTAQSMALGERLGEMEDARPEWADRALSSWCADKKPSAKATGGDDG